MATRSLLRVPNPSLQINTAGFALGRRVSLGLTPPASPGVPGHSSPSLVRTKSCPFPSASLNEEAAWPLTSCSIANKRLLPESPTKTQALASRVAYPTESAPEEAFVGSWQQVSGQDQYSAVRRRLWHTLYRVHSMDLAVVQERSSESEDAVDSSNAAAELERAYGASGGLASSSESVFAAGEEPVADICLGEQCVTALELGSAQALAEWLAQRLPAEAQVPQWGLLKGTKPVANLFQELQEGEISLEDGTPPKRTVHVASVKILSSEGLVLVESHQSMGNGTRRPRNRPLSEKMKPGEGVEAACLRGIYEELGSELGARNKVRLLPGTYEREEEERESCSYPGLPTRYVLHSLKAVVRDLPERAFETVENEGEACCSGSGPAAEQHIAGDGNGVGNGVALGGKTVGVRTHHWVWRREEEIGRTRPD